MPEGYRWNWRSTISFSLLFSTIISILALRVKKELIAALLLTGIVFLLAVLHIFPL